MRKSIQRTVNSSNEIKALIMGTLKSLREKMKITGVIEIGKTTG